MYGCVLQLQPFCENIFAITMLLYLTQHWYFILITLSFTCWCRGSNGAFSHHALGQTAGRNVDILTATIMNCMVRVSERISPNWSQMRRLDPEHNLRLSRRTAWHHEGVEEIITSGEMVLPRLIRATSKLQECPKALIPQWPLIIGCGTFPLCISHCSVHSGIQCCCSQWHCSMTATVDYISPLCIFTV